MAANSEDGDAVRHSHGPSAAEDGLLRILERGRERAAVDAGGADQVIGYDEDGLPR